MGSSNVNKVLPVVDMLLVLVVVLFATSGLLRSVPPAGVDPNVYEALLAEQDRLDTEVKSKKAETAKLEQDLENFESQDTPSSKTLETLLHASSDEQEKIAQAKIVVSDMCEKLDSVKRTVEDQRYAVVLEQEIKALKEKAARLEEEKARLEKTLVQTQDEKKKIQELKRELETLKKEIDRLKVILKNLTGSGPWPTGGYYGPFILIECNDKGAHIYPGGRRISLDTLDSEKEWLKQRVLEKGAALLIVRPSGFNKSYYEFRKVLVDMALKREGMDEDGIILTFWPVDEHADIAKYMPEGDIK